MKVQLSQKAWPLRLLLAASLLPGAVFSTETFIGKCIGVTDGDTITVLKGQEQVKIRLYGIDCPEPGDDFSSKAKKFTASLAFGKEVRVEPTDTDRYGRLVARVHADGIDVSQALLQAGLAWHYKKYSTDADLARAEATAKAAEIGVWSLPNPAPPWEIQRLRSGSTAPSEESRTVYHGNTNSRVFHAPWCRYYNCQNCTRVFRSRKEAIAAGFRPGGHCKP